MKNDTSFHRCAYLVMISLLLLGSACNNEGSHLTDSQPAPTVRVLFASSGLGDMSYNDNILRAILEAQKQNNFQLEYISPKDNSEAEEIVRKWEAETNSSYFTIFAASEYESLAQHFIPATSPHDYLMFDTRADNISIPTFHFTGYGVSFLAGVAAYTQTKADQAAYIGGQQHEAFIEECYDGFRDGYLHAGGKEVVATYISPTQKGFAMPQRAYEMADSLYKLYPFIYVMAGNSNNGVYQYLRDYPENKYTAGVDTDQSAYSSQIIGSMIKEIGRCVTQYIDIWIKGEPLPMKEQYTLESGFMSFKVAEPYKAALEKAISDNLQIAINKESEYESNN